MKTPALVEARIRTLFTRCPMLHGFAVQDRDLVVTDIGIYPKVDAMYDEIHDEIKHAISDLVHDQPHACDYLRGRTFARALH
ncbi:MAG: hypothetical protein ACREUS_07520 [Burkholderiales bacterium]